MGKILDIIQTLTPKQQDTLSRIAIDDDNGVNPSIANVLIKKGLIEKFEEKNGMLTIYRYRVPLSVHIAWCEWCSKQFDEM